jgi:hypothetical protein
MLRLGDKILPGFIEQKTPHSGHFRPVGVFDYNVFPMNTGRK